MEQIMTLLHDIGANPLHALSVIFMIILLEVILSVDNAAVLATMVIDLPKEKRNKALRYGIIGAYVFRGLALLFASVIINIWWLKPIGGLYLLYLTFKFFKAKSTEDAEDDKQVKSSSWFYKLLVKYVGVFWTTVVMVEFLDIVFSIDNIFAVVAFSNNIILVCFGVFVGILAMRFVAQRFVKLMEKHSYLETSAFVVIGILGLKLLLSVVSHFYTSMKWLDGELTDWVVSGLTLLVFFAPMLWKAITKKKEVKPSPFN